MGVRFSEDSHGNEDFTDSISRMYKLTFAFLPMFTAANGTGTSAWEDKSLKAAQSSTAHAKVCALKQSVRSNLSENSVAMMNH